MKILLLGFNQSKKSYSAKRLVAELKKRGHTVTYMSWRGLVFSFDKKGPSIKRINGTDLKFYDFIIPKAPISTTKTKGGAFLSHLYRHYLLVVKYFNQHHKHVLNEKTTQKIPFYDKLLQYYLLGNKNIPIVPSVLYTGRHLPTSVYKKYKKPYIIKGLEGRAGKQVFLIKNTKTAKELVAKFGIGRLLVQKYIPTKHDYRVIVLGGRVIGAMRRTAAEGDFRANISLGGSAEAATISKEMALLAKKAASVFNAEFAGVDIIKYKGRYYVLEVNIFPGLEGFEKATKINATEELVKYIEKKYLWSIQTEFTKKEKGELFDDLYKIEKENIEKPPKTKKEFRETILKRDLIVVNKEQKPIAYLTHYKKGNVRRITRYGILPQYRGQRMGRRMLRAIIALAKQHHDTEINAVLPVENKRRQLTFKRAGFRKTEEIIKERFGEGHDGAVFAYTLKPGKKLAGPGLTETKVKPKKPVKKKKQIK